MHTLLATTGASPQIITETLYAIHHENRQWPDEIFLITTSFGTEKAVEGLIRQKHLQRLCGEIQRPLPAFDASHVLVTPGADGTEVEDARSLQDHEALANFIMTEVRNRTASPQGSLHASLAGGRKTMTFYIGYAMSLFGRVQDTLSHVLVSDGYESQPDFWFPTKERCLVSNRQNQTLDASQARITLALIPFIRHRLDLPQVLLQNNDIVKFADLVELINLGETPDALRLVIDLPQKTIRLQDHHSHLSIDLNPGLLDLAFYSMMARATREGEHTLRRPDPDIKDSQNPGKKIGDIDMSIEMVKEMLVYCNKKSKEHLEGDILQLKDADLGLSEKSLNVLSDGVTRTWFDSRQTHLRQEFERGLPNSLLRWVMPTIIWAEDGSRLSLGDAAKAPKGGGYGLNLKASQIHLIEP